MATGSYYLYQCGLSAHACSISIHSDEWLETSLSESFQGGEFTLLTSWLTIYFSV